ncbi:MAG: Type 1 glutamine amidotransferase-like domain-containing protein [Candidatus Aenigmatarchaeota archaeon]
MKFYLSSYSLGNKVQKLKKMLSKNKKTAFISNAMDYVDDMNKRKQKDLSGMEELRKVGMKPELLDLRDYFNKREKLKRKVKEFGAFWVTGGNVFVLRHAMKLSGFDSILVGMKNRDDILYGGYSAGVCVLAPTLRGMNLMDYTGFKLYSKEPVLIWEGLGILDYSVVPHYKSDHPESKLADKVVEYMIENKLPFRPLRNGEVIIIE